MESLDLVEEEERQTADGLPYFIIKAKKGAALDEDDIKPFQKYIDIMSKIKDQVILELAATYDSFRERNYDHEKSLDLLNRKKGSKCTPERIEKSMELLMELGLPAK